MTESLRQKQSRFARQLPRLLDYAHSLGYEVTLGECYRTPEQAELNAIGGQGMRDALASLIEHAFPRLAGLVRRGGRGIRTSLHTQRLAIDLQLFDQGGKWITEEYPYRLLGEYWESLGADHRAGFRFGDPGHYSIEHEGRK